MNDFQKQGYLYVPCLIDTSAYYRFFGKLVESGRGDAGDKQVPGSTCFYKNPLFEKLLEHLLPKIEAHTGHELYSYARQYEIGNELSRMWTGMPAKSPQLWHWAMKSKSGRSGSKTAKKSTIPFCCNLVMR